MPTLLELWLIFLTALLGSGHCIGMCGGLAASCSLGLGEQSFAPRLSLPLYYSLGRMGMYMLLGAVSGSLGSLQLLYGRPGAFAGVPHLLAALFMIWVGIRTVGWWGGEIQWSGWKGLSSLSQRLQQLPPGQRAWAMGVLTGLLPCSFHWAFQIQALASGSLASGVLILLAFGLGTLPALLGFAYLTTWLDSRARRRILQVAGALMIIMGLLTLRRAWLVSHFV
ncbi:sulfite exporter TauE/SafE family protein [Candidatus Magnetaquicoccus inordinatus]|uniref:sulfite exporter TauE/SafE family protein n=1 Tax=Candidatus Magnetaquicoccus inordinatus TaxID=2496818 RepID=UPI00187D386A|nr:sulfite exporter TauE/SafE family protein [Candidatus Magnetaquicoccus inordinatus]